eukprot:2462193-Prymnesium_polylepis.1
MGLACANASCSLVDEEQTVGRFHVRQPVTAPVVRLVASKKLRMLPVRYGPLPNWSVATPRKTESQSQSC